MSGPDGPGGVDASVRVGDLALANPVMVASGTAGHGAELAAYLDLAALGAVVVKSLSVDPWPGNPAPRVHETRAGMLNSVGLQGPGVRAWADESLGPLRESGARTVVSVWGRTVEAFGRAAAEVDALDGPVAIEANVSCPNVEERGAIFAHSPAATAAAVRAVRSATRLPVWAKLSPNTPDLVEVAAAAVEAGADALTLVNTVLGLLVDVEARRPALGAGGGGLSGPAIHPVALRAVYDVHAAMPGVPIVGVGGISCGADAVAMMMAGASAVQVGTATLRDPRAPAIVAGEIVEWCAAHGVASVASLTGAAHG